MELQIVRWIVPLRYAAVLGTATVLLNARVGYAHHTYAMFDMRQSAVVEGSIAKLEWTNPHVFVWLYVKKPEKPGEYDLWAFENGPVSLMSRQGWTKDSLEAGQKVRVQYFPLRDGRTGGYFVRLVHENGAELIGDPYAPGVAKELDEPMPPGPPSP